ncbi:hypothetical protein [Treponema pectinovorum]|uniref:hypothetical protein n=1 Tax=Treponema pectinovorum TaxID=164 RepID=UPI0011C7772F|nr:hypothetical protein [Treponema pectinovorum]
MNSKKLNKILCCFAIFSFSLFLISIFAVKKVEQKSIKSALVNPSYKEKIGTIFIKDSQETITLRFLEDFWILEKKGINTFADKKNVEELIRNLSKIRSMYKISDNYKSRIDLKLTDEDAKILIVIDKSGNIISKLYFGEEDFLTSRLTVASQKSKVSYQTENDLSIFLNCDLDFWTEKEIFFAVKNPSNLNINTSSLESLLNLRHGKISLDFDKTKATFVRSISLLGQYETQERIDIFLTDENGTEQYFYSHQLTPKIIESNSYYEISQWTYEKLISLVK